MARPEAPLSKLPWMADCPTNTRGITTEGTQYIIISVFVCILKALANTRGSYPLADIYGGL